MERPLKGTAFTLVSLHVCGTWRACLRRAGACFRRGATNSSEPLPHVTQRHAGQRGPQTNVNVNANGAEHDMRSWPGQMHAAEVLAGAQRMPVGCSTPQDAHRISRAAGADVANISVVHACPCPLRSPR